jgi:hypothetical protein
LYSVQVSRLDYIATANIELYNFWTTDIQPTKCANTLVQKQLLDSDEI